MFLRDDILCCEIQKGLFRWRRTASMRKPKARAGCMRSVIQGKSHPGHETINFVQNERKCIVH